MLDDATRIMAIDSSNMSGIADKFARLCEDALVLGERFEIPEKVRVNSEITIVYSRPSQIIVVGMGGSAMGGDLLRSWLLDRCPIPIETCRDYHLPGYAGPRTLVIAVSYSGNTEETLNAFLEAVERGCMTVSISSGGFLGEFSDRFGLPHLQIPSGYPPRSAIPFLFFPLASVLMKLDVIPSFDAEAVEAISTLKTLGREISIASTTGANPSKRLAISLEGLIPMVCGFGQFEAVASRMKTQFNENSKTPAKSEFFPELNHNETLGWTGPKNLTKIFGVVIIRSDDEPVEMRTRIEITKELMLNQGAGVVTEIWSRGSGRLARMLSVMYIGDFASIYLGVLYGMDPTSMSIIEELKKQLGDRLKKTDELKRRVEELLA